MSNQPPTTAIPPTEKGPLLIGGASVPTLLFSGLLLLAGVASAGLGLEGFLVPNHFVDGGVTGLSMLVADLAEMPLPVLLILINAPFIAIGYRFVGRGFAIMGGLGILLLALALTFVHFPVVTDDKLLAAVFGGFFLGAGIGLSVRAGGVLDGTEILALLVSRRFGVTIGDVIIIVNLTIFSLAALLIDVETALYSMLTYIAASRTIDFVIHGIEEYQGVMIISPAADEIREMIIEDLGRGVTIYQGYGGRSKAELDILFCVVTRLELPKLRRRLKQIDADAFLVVHAVSDASGGVVKKRVTH